ncbi:hypothetical protein [Legionella cardiaca]|uniref:DUF4189 domain-containing protein n=1 Tax=Legionella cardiaca TaxID=1071983 RepID=A0ABY8AUP1_9GAMM|nr:hypothetical protein [Legionella cardiaca]WED44303.1 hypothetical protein PXX05_05820 [Legionella cardiaca]
MNNKVLTLFLGGCFLLSQASHAATVLDINYWKCTASDTENREWYGQSDYQLTALNRAMEDCKKQSRAPSTCKTSKADCESIVNGETTRAMWRCVALDLAAIPWPSNIYNHADDALLGAKAYCQANSALPETCYVYLFTCRNLNIRKF